MKKQQIIILKSLLLGLALIIFLPYTTLAIGPGTGGSKIRVDEEQVGSYKLLVATSPLPVTTAQPMSVWVRVTAAATDQLRRNAVVTIKAIPREKGPTMTAQATHQNAGNDFDYVGHLEVAQTGQWDVTVTITEDELGEAEITFTETVSSWATTRFLVGLAIPFVVLTVAVGIYLWRRSGTD
jgi:hypothetical protein